jgi:hypothetical protein
MDSQTTPGLNRTGAKMSPLDTSAMQQYADNSPYSESNDTLAQLRTEAIAEADSVGSVPLPGTVKGAVKTGVAKLKGQKPEVLIDKLGERLAFERTGTRLYEALITKAEHILREKDAALLDELRRIHTQEAEHFRLLSKSLDALGADPTAQTPGADVAAVMSTGILQVVTDPRTNLAQCLNAMLVAELADNASWELLLKLVKQAGQDKWMPDFQRASLEEQDHLAVIKRALEAAVLTDAL